MHPDGYPQIKINKYHKLLGKARITEILPHLVKAEPITFCAPHHKVLWITTPHLKGVQKEGYYVYKATDTGAWIELWDYDSMYSDYEDELMAEVAFCAGLIRHIQASPHYAFIKKS